MTPSQKSWQHCPCVCICVCFMGLRRAVLHMALLSGSYIAGHVISHQVGYFLDWSGRSNRHNARNRWIFLGYDQEARQACEAVELVLGAKAEHQRLLGCAFPGLLLCSDLWCNHTPLFGRINNYIKATICLSFQKANFYPCWKWNFALLCVLYCTRRTEQNFDL